MTKSLHWADQAAERIIKERGNKDKYTIAAGITPSGIIHIGNFREIITQELVGRGLERLGKKVRFIYSWDDFDAFRKIPSDAPKQDVLKQNLRKPVSRVPDVFDEKHDSYARHHQERIEKDLPKAGIEPEFIYQHKMHGSCKYAEPTRHALRSRDKIRKILDKFRKDPLPDDWFPLTIYCEECWKDTTKIRDYDEEYFIAYDCRCDHSGTIDLREDGQYKLLWRIDWPMRWAYEEVDFESAGKDHSTVGGSFDTGDIIIEEIWKKNPPVHFMYDFIRIKGGGGKMSSSTGDVVDLGEVLRIYTPELTRYLFAGTRPGAEFALSFDTEVLQVYDEFDRAERIYFGAEEAKNEKEEFHLRRVYELSIPLPEKMPKKLPMQPGLRHLTNLVQIFPDDVERVISYFGPENEMDRRRILERAKCALHWVKEYAPEQFRFSIQDKIPSSILNELSGKEKKALLHLVSRLSEDTGEDSLMGLFSESAENAGIDRKDFFRAAYRALICKERGPRLATLIQEIGYDKVKSILEQLSP